MLLTVFVVAATLAFQGVSGKRPRLPIFLEPRVCLEFDVVCNISDYQARSYNSSLWVGVPLPNVGDFRSSFRCLKQYARGQNSQGSAILMTAQFLASFNGSRLLNLFWLLPKDRQANPPRPVNGSRVFLTSFSQMFVYSKTVRTRFSNVNGEAKTLNTSLARDGANYNDSTNFAAFCKSYDIWFISNGFPICPIP